MNQMRMGLALAGALAAGNAQAGGSVSCQVAGDLAEGGEGAPTVSELIWSTAGDGSPITGAADTSVGRIAAGDDLKSITLEGTAVQLPAHAHGLLRFGKVYDYGGAVVLAYRVERQDDASATPSEVVYRLDRAGIAGEVEILPGGQWEAPGHCILVE